MERLQKKPVTLIVPKNAEVTIGREMLIKAGIGFRILPTNDPQFQDLTIIAREGDFSGVAGVKEYVGVVTNRPLL